KRYAKKHASGWTFVYIYTCAYLFNKWSKFSKKKSTTSYYCKYCIYYHAC
ncbi:hypothetical protein ACJX0J_010732, partial [Zea mays]